MENDLNGFFTSIKEFATEEYSNPEILKSIILLSGRYNQLTTDYNLGKINYEVFTAGKGQILDNSIEIINSISETITDNIQLRTNQDKVNIRVSLQDDFENYPVKELADLFNFIKESSYDYDSVKIVDLSPGSVIVTVEIERNSFNKFLNYFNDQRAEKYGIVNMEFFTKPTNQIADYSLSNIYDSNERQKILLKEAIGKGLSSGLNAVKKKLNPVSTKFNELIALYSRYNSLKSDRNSGIIPHEDKTEENSIIQSLIDMIDNLMEEDLDENAR